MPASGNAEATYLLAKKMIEAGVRPADRNQVSDEKKRPPGTARVTVPHEVSASTVPAATPSRTGVEDGIIVDLH